MHVHRAVPGPQPTPPAPALGGNLLGVTSWLLGLDGGQLAGRLKLDVLWPVRGSMRCYNPSKGYGKGGRGGARIIIEVRTMGGQLLSPALAVSDQEKCGVPTCWSAM